MGIAKSAKKKAGWKDSTMKILIKATGAFARFLIRAAFRFM